MPLKYPAAKRLARHLYSLACGLGVAANLVVPRRQTLAVYYGGARSGDRGGTLVKVKRLREYFPEVRWGYNLVYVLSNAPYLPDVAFTLLKSRGVPVVHNQNGVFYGAWYAGDWRAENRRMARSYHAADWVFHQSDFCRQAADRFLGPRVGPSEILYNAVDTAVFTPADDHAAPVRGRYRFLVTGKIDSHLSYRLESTIAGLRVARDLGLDAAVVVAGWVDADARAWADAQVKALGLDGMVTFTGAYTQRQAPGIYRDAHGYVMLKHNDPCPNTVLEALSAGLPVLYSDSGGVPELVGPDAGIVLPCPEDWDTPRVPTPDAVGEGMVRLAANHPTLASNARRRAVARFDIGAWIDRHRAVFHQLTAIH